MTPPLRPRRRAMTLIEVVAAVAIAGLAAAGLVGYLAANAHVRMHAEARRQAAVAAHERCLMFQAGLLHADHPLWPAGQLIEHTVAAPPDLPGGLPVRLARDRLEVSADGRTVTFYTVVEVETSRPTPSRAEASITLFR